MGANDWVQVAYDSSLFSGGTGNPMTISFWANSDITDYSSNAYAVSMFDFISNDRMWGVSISLSTDRWSIATGSGAVGGVVDTSQAVESGWHYIVAVSVNNTARSWEFYYDGVGESITASHTYTDESSDLTIGALIGGFNEFDGTIDEVVIWNRSLSSSEISEIYQRQKDKYGGGDNGTYTSQIFDAGGEAGWNNISWTGNESVSGNLTFQARNCSLSNCGDGSFASVNLRKLEFESEE